MKRSQFDASTFGVGELITQKKLFRVPRHQRSFAWSRELVRSFVSDIEVAFLNNSLDYFVGLIVIQGPEDGEWILLDGQQRLTTSTMLFAAIRNWLFTNNFADDARQIETEFLGVRRLGGEYSSRLQLNSENQEIYKQVVIDKNAADKTWHNSDFAKKASNYLLADAAVECQKWVNYFVDSLANSTEKADMLFKLSAFLESKLKVVCVEVSNDVDAYTLFESLNDRGIELSALDLVKNYAYSKSTDESVSQFDAYWLTLVKELEGKNPDDFLKISWTAKHGTVQKTQLFRKIRQDYRTEKDVLEFLKRLSEDANILVAIDDPEHTLWNNYPQETRENLYTLLFLGSKQVKPVILSGISNLEPSALSDLLWLLVVTVVRYQIISKGRTGVMEKVFGLLCISISQKISTKKDDFREIISELWVDDQTFKSNFSKYSDFRFGRYGYFLASIELFLRNRREDYKYLNIRDLLANTDVISSLTSQSPEALKDRGPDFEKLSIGSFSLIEKDIEKHDEENSSLFSKSSLLINRRLTEDAKEDGGFFFNAVLRSMELSQIAVMVWSF